METKAIFDELYQRGCADQFGAFFEQIIETCYRNILREGMHAVDCGANRGRHTVPMSQAVGETGKVFSIEAIPEVARELAGYCGKNVQVINAAVGAENIDKVNFHYVRGNDGLSGLNNPLRHPSMTPEIAGSTATIQVRQEKLDDLLPSAPWPFRKRIRFIKMDLEGGEFNALRGAARTMSRDRPMIIFENAGGYSANLYNYTAEQFFEFFASLGYSVFDLFGREIGLRQWNEPGYPWYSIAVSRSSLDERYVRERHLGEIAKI
jgi:FkbM family methyltransferase